MTDQAHALRRLMARATRIAHEASYARFERQVAAESHEYAPLIRSMEDCRQNASDRGDEPLPEKPHVEREPNESRIERLREPQDIEQTSSPQKQETRMALLIGGRRGVGTSTLAEQLAEALKSRGDAVEIQACDGATETETKSNGDLDWVVIDGGSTFGPQLKRLWARADSVTVVTTTDANSVTGSYRLIKSAMQRGLSLGSMGMVVNQAVDEKEARQAGRRLRRCCERFLGHCRDRDPDWVLFDGEWMSGCKTGASHTAGTRAGECRAITSGRQNIDEWAERVLAQASQTNQLEEVEQNLVG